MIHHVKVDLNNPVFQQSLFALQKQSQLDCLRSLRKITEMTWQMIYVDRGLRWEKISSIQPPTGIDQVYSIRVTKATRAIVYREGEVMRFLAVFDEHDAAYGKK
jgi:hypothetical protein